MPSINQLLKTNRKKKKRYSRTLIFEKKHPQKKGYCAKLLVKTPRKPNSALRKVARVSVSSVNKKIFTFLPGEGHSLQKFSQILVRGGRRKDLPGMKYTAVRGKYDFQPPYKRTNARSKYGVRKLD